MGLDDAHIAIYRARVDAGEPLGNRLGTRHDVPDLVGRSVDANLVSN